MRGQKLYRIKLHGKRRLTWRLAASLFRATLVHSQYRCTKNGPCSESELAADSLRCQSRTICHARRAIASARSWPHSILTRYTETFATMSSATMPVLPSQLGRNVREWNGSRTRLHGATAVVEIGRGLPPKCAAAVLEEQCLGVMARPTLTRVSAMTARPTQRCSEPAGHAGLRGPRLGARGCGATV
jgi:hypothetical protein